MTSREMAVVSYEDRPTSFVGVKLLLLSLAKYSPQIPVYLYVPDRSMTDAMAQWLRYRAPQVKLRDVSDGCPTGWSAKPFILNDVLNRDCATAVWIDADIIVTGNIEARLGSVPEHTLSVASEIGTHDSTRATVWGYSVCRPLPALINTCVVRCTKRHMLLLKAWAELTQQPRYLEVQQLPWNERIAAYHGDQDLLEGLLISDALPPAHRPEIDIVAHDHDVFHGIAIPVHRLLSLNYKLPLFVHAHGLKPWHLKYIGWPNRRKLKYVALELSLYSWIARQFAEKLDDPDFESWVNPETVLATACDTLTTAHPYLRQAPVQLYQKIAFRISRFFGPKTGCR